MSAGELWQGTLVGLSALGIAVVAAGGVLCLLNLGVGRGRLRALPERLYAVADPAFERTIGAVLAPQLVGGNQVETLFDGDRIFPAMLDALHAAATSITFETYIFWSSTIGLEFERAFADAARRGVAVKVLLDWIGGRLHDDNVERMRAAGVEVRLYNPPRWHSLGRFNNRTHRKLMVVDGRVGFIGGVGIADEWRGRAQDPAHWRGTHFRVEGPVVAQIQSAFVDNWLGTTGEALHGDRFLPPLPPAGPLDAHVFMSSQGGGSKGMQLLYLLSITAAVRSIDMSAAYFVPDGLARAALIDAVGRGVEVRIIVPGPIIDKKMVRHASRAVWGPLLEAGVQIFEYQPTMFHCKVMVVDRLWVSLGSSNFDPRSFRINDEANMNVYDAGFAVQQSEVFENDLRHARCVTAAAWRARPWSERLLGRAASAFASQM